MGGARGGRGVSGKKDVETANEVFKTPATGIKLLLAAIYPQQLPNLRAEHRTRRLPGRPRPARGLHAARVGGGGPRTAVRGVQRGPPGMVNLQEMGPLRRGLWNSRTETHSPCPARTAIAGGSGWEGQGGRSRRDRRRRRAPWREHPPRTLPTAQLQGVAVCPREGRGDSGERGRERAGLGGRSVDPALLTRSRKRFCLFSPWLRAAPGSPEPRPRGRGGRHRARRLERGHGDGQTAARPPGEAGGSGRRTTPPPRAAPGPGEVGPRPRRSRSPGRPPAWDSPQRLEVPFLEQG